jgi:hypothetical protein
MLWDRSIVTADAHAAAAATADENVGRVANPSYNAFSEQMDMPGVPGNTAHEKGCILPDVIVHKRDR